MFLRGELEKKIFREALPIAFNRFIEAESRNVINLGEVGIENNALVSDDADERMDVEADDIRFVHGKSKLRAVFNDECFNHFNNLLLLAARRVHDGLAFLTGGKRTVNNR